MTIEAFLAELSIVAFDVAVLNWPSGRDEVQADFVLVGPLIEDFGSEFGSVVDDDARRQSARLTQLPSNRTTRSAGNEVSTLMANISRV